MDLARVTNNMLVDAVPQRRPQVSSIETLNRSGTGVILLAHSMGNKVRQSDVRGLPRLLFFGVQVRQSRSYDQSIPYTPLKIRSWTMQVFCDRPA